MSFASTSDPILTAVVGGVAGYLFHYLTKPPASHAHRREMAQPSACNAFAAPVDAPPAASARKGGAYPLDLHESSPDEGGAAKTDPKIANMLDGRFTVEDQTSFDEQLSGVAIPKKDASTALAARAAMLATMRETPETLGSRTTGMQASLVDIAMGRGNVKPVAKSNCDMLFYESEAHATARLKASA